MLINNNHKDNDKNYIPKFIYMRLNKTLSKYSICYKIKFYTFENIIIYYTIVIKINNY